ncbi:hypothetical protein INS49_009423 [Diaporthe citri]|uniref:uncharacterized protein n=1 Tax=Diaporthe citri TaxID=83186 RepID=UPI001C8135C1|nr:uncharacterized protein INS49_009423 [Diaporthe citri]KAG6361199.1 hypothetical protein INS49_009423 [Diaporthe citri]
MTSQLYPTVGLKGFKSKPDVEAYLAAFSADEFDTFFQYYHPDIHIDIPLIPGPKTISGYHQWAKGHHQIASETLVPQKIIFDLDGGLVVVEVRAEFRGKKGVEMDDFFGWGPVSEGTGPDVTMIVFYHLDERGRVVHLEPGATKLLRKAQAANVAVGGSAVAGSGSSFRTKDDVRRYIGFFSSNDFGKASEFWAPELEVRLGKLQVIHGREENVKFFSEQRVNGMDENVAPKQITLDDSCCVLHAEVTFIARKDFPEGYAGMGTTSGGIKTGQRIWNEMMILYDLDNERRVRVVRTYRLSGPVISGPD